MTEQERKENTDFYILLGLLRASKSWGDVLKTSSFLKGDTKYHFNNGLNGINQIIKNIEKVIPKELMNQMEDDAFIFNDVFDSILKAESEDDKLDKITLYKMVAENKIKLEK